MARCRVVLTFPPDKVEKPVAYHLVKDFDLRINILRAKVDLNEEGKLLIEIENHKQEAIQRGLQFVREQGVQVELVDKELQWDEEECTNCGACTAVCRPRALHLEAPDWKLVLDKQKCTACGLCVDACPVKVIRIDF